MSYHYQDYRSHVFTEEGQINFLKVRDKANHILNVAGAVMMEKLVEGLIGLSWEHFAYVDRLVEIDELVEINNTESHAGQHRIFIRNLQ
jgi:hypothetical protein